MFQPPFVAIFREVL